MAQISSLPLRLLGEIKLCGADWDGPEFARLFSRLGTVGNNTGAALRYIRYDGRVSGQNEVRFFGIGIGSLVAIPPGMAVIELDEDSVSIYRPALAGPVLAWHGRLAWNWFNGLIASAPVGEFTVRSPADWTSKGDSPLVEFIMSSNSYFEKDKPPRDEVSLTDYDP